GGRSLLNAITFAQADALRVALANGGTALPVYVGMRNWQPYIAEALGRLADDGRREAVGVILAPHSTEASRARYTDAVAHAGAQWLEPDVNDALRALAAAGTRDAVVVPIGFVADHVEVLYDLDVEAAATARAAGLGFVRVPTVNDHPLFVRMLAELVREAAW